MMKKILLMDLDNTILDFTRSEKEALTYMLKHYGVTPSDELLNKYASINQKYWGLLEKKEALREDIVYLRFEEFFKTCLDREINGHEANEIYHSLLKELGYQLPESEEFLKKAKSLGYKIIIISNGSKCINPNRIERSGLKQYFDEIYISEEVGYDKPDVRFFEPILKKYPNKEEMIIIGDSLTSDIQSGLNLGIPTIWYNKSNKKSDKPDYEIKSLNEIFDILIKII